MGNATKLTDAQYDFISLTSWTGRVSRGRGSEKVATRKLIELGYVVERPGGALQITNTGIAAWRSEAARRGEPWDAKMEAVVAQIPTVADAP